METAMKAQRFLMEQGLSDENIRFEKTLDDFLDEMKKGLDGKVSSLKMIPTYLTAGQDVPVGKKITVLDAGGTNFRVATVHFDKAGQAVVERFEKHTMPGIEQELSKDDFFAEIAGHVEPYLSEADSISFCFSYPTEIQPDRDGRLIAFTKEIKAPEVEGALIGKGLLAALPEKYQNKEILILNDTVATLLAGQAQTVGQSYSSYAGFILGTGTNTAYIEKTDRIAALSREASKGETMIINTESGGYCGKNQGPVDKTFTAMTDQPDLFHNEKMISGAYLGGLCLTALSAAAQQGLFSKDFGKAIQEIKELETRDVSDFLSITMTGENLLSPIMQDAGEDDIIFTYHIVSGIIQRAAKLTAVNLSAAVLKCGQGQNPLSPVLITVDGTTFFKLKDFQCRVDDYMRRHLTQRRGLYYRIVHAKDATLLGTAIAGLTNLA